jgi:hypothetical protein
VAQALKDRLESVLFELRLIVVGEVLAFALVQLAQPGVESGGLVAGGFPPGIGGQQLIEVVVGEEILVAVEIDHRKGELSRILGHWASWVRGKARGVASIPPVIGGMGKFRDFFVTAILALCVGEYRLFKSTRPIFSVFSHSVHRTKSLTLGAPVAKEKEHRADGYDDSHKGKCRQEHAYPVPALRLNPTEAHKQETEGDHDTAIGTAPGRARSTFEPIHRLKYSSVQSSIRAKPSPPAH